MPIAKIELGVLDRALREVLGLRHPPVALSFILRQPTGVETFSGEVPSACNFWRTAETSVFFAPAHAHYHCPIGALTMGFAMPQEHGEHLAELVATMCETGYLSAAEAANIPSVPGEHHGILYGPLGTFPSQPDAVIVWVSPTGMMLLAEATNQSGWTPHQSGITTFGRPSCAAIAIAVQRQAPAFSVGCTGMRIFTGIDPDLELAVLPKTVLADLAQHLTATATANAHMTSHYTAQKERFTSTAPANHR